MKNLLLTIFTLVLFTTNIFAQLGTIEVGDNNNAILRAKTPQYYLPTEVQLHSGDSTILGGYTQYNIRNENDILNIDVTSDLLPEDSVLGLVRIFNTGDIITTGAISVGNSNLETNGSIRFNGTSYQAYLNGTWNNICLGCAPTGCNDFEVSSPNANASFSQEFSINASNQMVINVIFNEPVNTATVTLESTFIFTSGGTNIPGNITWNGSNTIATFTSSTTYGNFCAFTPDCFMQLQLIGTDNGNGAIENSNGCNLDGDNNGTQGGNYTTTFGILG